MEPQKVHLYIQKTSPLAQTPIYATDDSAGLDLASPYFYKILPHTQILVETELKIMFPEGTYGQLLSRSGLAVQHGIHVGAGVLDPDYRGTVKVLLLNMSNQSFDIAPGDRIAQLLVHSLLNTQIIEVSCLPATKRGSEGFGSTGGYQENKKTKTYQDSASKA